MSSKLLQLEKENSIRKKDSLNLERCFIGSVFSINSFPLSVELSGCHLPSFYTIDQLNERLYLLARK